jgi:hypothetical protein
MRIYRGWARLSVLIFCATVGLTACASSRPRPSERTATTTATTPSHLHDAPRIAVTHFGALTLRHPTRWRAYLTPDDADLPNGDGAYLTDQPISARCIQTPMPTAVFVHCPDPLDFPRGPSAGRIWIEVETDYRPLVGHARNDLTVGGYHAQVDASVNDSGGYPVDSSGLPVPYCSAHTHHAVQVTALAPNTAVQPSTVVITACFGTHTSLAQRQFRTMLQTTTITTRPSETAPVPGAHECTRNDLRLSYSEQGANQSILATYSFTNRANTTCSLHGYPRLVLITSAGSIAEHIDYRRQGHPHQLFLRPGQSVSATTQTFLNSDLAARAHATVELINLPGVHEPFRQPLDRGGIPIFHNGPTVDVSPLSGD